MKKIILAVTGASGSLYAQSFIRRVTEMTGEVEECTLIFSRYGKSVWEHELQQEPDYSQFPMIRTVDHTHMFDSVASGSSGYQSMVILPCSMGTMGRIASGTSEDLIVRAADVMLKEKRTLIIVPREAPYNSIHLENMLKLNNAGAHIIPASPFFYHQPASIEELVNPFVERILQKTGLSANPFVW
jgi:flavin prenyltransferase